MSIEETTLTPIGAPDDSPAPPAPASPPSPKAPIDIKAAVRDFLADTANRWMMGIFAVAAYLVLVNLGAAPLWHDEGNLGLLAKMFLKTGGLEAWDGRTFYIGANGSSINSDFKIATFPPLPMLPSALGIALFGHTEFAVRIFHSLIGLASLWLFWQLLRMEFPLQQRLRVLAFALFALSTQALLFMRVGRYVADSFFFTLLLLYAYRLYIAPGGNTRHLAVAAFATLLNFFNHFAIGIAFALSLAGWHLIYHWGSTTRRQWQEIAIAGVVVIAVCLGYLWWMKLIFSGGTLEFGSESYQTPLLQRKLIVTAQNFRDVVWFGILPMWLVVWMAWYIGYGIFQRYKAPIYEIYHRFMPPEKEEDGDGAEADHADGDGDEGDEDAEREEEEQDEDADEAEDQAEEESEGEEGEGDEDEREEKEEDEKAAALPPLDFKRKILISWLVLWVLFLFFSGVLSVREPTASRVADTRYIAPILLFVALVGAAFVDWLWRWRAAGKPIALLALAALLTTNLLAHPFAYPNAFTKQKFYATLSNFVAEVQHPFQNYMSDVLFYLRTHSKQDETIYVVPWQEFTIMQFYLSEKLIFCCSLDEDSPLPKDKMRELGVPFYKGDARPDWLVIASVQAQKFQGYELVYQSKFHAYPTHRPELEWRTFKPLFAHPQYGEQSKTTPGATFRVYKRVL